MSKNCDKFLKVPEERITPFDVSVFFYIFNVKISCLYFEFQIKKYISRILRQ